MKADNGMVRGRYYCCCGGNDGGLRSELGGGSGSLRLVPFLLCMDDFYPSWEISRF